MALCISTLRFYGSIRLIIHVSCKCFPVDFASSVLTAHSRSFALRPAAQGGEKRGASFGGAAARAREMESRVRNTESRMRNTKSRVQKNSSKIFQTIVAIIQNSSELISVFSHSTSIRSDRPDMVVDWLCTKSAPRPSEATPSVARAASVHAKVQLSAPQYGARCSGRFPWWRIRRCRVFPC